MKEYCLFEGVYGKVILVIIFFVFGFLNSIWQFSIYI